MSTQVISVQCNKCGAPLQVGQDTNYATCTYCGSSLQVMQSGGVTYTRVLEHIDSRLDSMQQENSLYYLDMRWAEQKKEFRLELDAIQNRLDTSGINTTRPLWWLFVKGRESRPLRNLMLRKTNLHYQMEIAEQAYLAERARLTNTD